MEFYL